MLFTLPQRPVFEKSGMMLHITVVGLAQLYVLLLYATVAFTSFWNLSSFVLFSLKLHVNATWQNTYPISICGGNSLEDFSWWSGVRNADNVTVKTNGELEHWGVLVSGHSDVHRTRRCLLWDSTPCGFHQQLYNEKKKKQNVVRERKHRQRCLIQEHLLLSNAILDVCDSYMHTDMCTHSIKFISIGMLAALRCIPESSF